jgi:hypothetical protein
MTVPRPNEPHRVAQVRNIAPVAKLTITVALGVTAI